MFRTPICDLLDIEYPIVLGGMAWTGTAEFVATVSNAGALGLIGSGNMEPDALRAEIDKARSLTEKTFGVNIVPLDARMPERVEVVIEKKVPVVSTGYSDPKKRVVMRLRNAGVKVIGVVPTVRLARRLEDEGVHAVVASGSEAGGHVGRVYTLPLVPQVVNAVNLPVLAAGGIGDGRGFVAALALGAQGIQMGTRFIATKECPVHEEYKKRILWASIEDTVVTGWFSGSPMRVIRNQLTDKWLRMEAEGASAEELHVLGLGKLPEALLTGNVTGGSVPAGQVSGMINEILTVKELIDKIIGEAKEICSNLKTLV